MNIIKNLKEKNFKKGYYLTYITYYLYNLDKFWINFLGPKIYLKLVHN